MQLYFEVLWSDLHDMFSHLSMLGIVIGDNSIMDHSEKSGGKGFCEQARKDFADFVLQSGFLTLPFSGSQFTWHVVRDRKAIWERLDRGLVNTIGILYSLLSGSLIWK